MLSFDFADAFPLAALREIRLLADGVIHNLNQKTINSTGKAREEYHGQSLRAESPREVDTVFLSTDET